MSDAKTALGGAVSASGATRIEEMPLQGMITLRGELESNTIKAAIQSVFGLAIPKQRETQQNETQGICWMSPDEALLLCPYDDAQSYVAKISDALSGEHALVANVSDARANFSLSGPNSRDVLAKLVPVDFAPGHFEPPMLRRTRLAQVPAAFWMRAENTFHIICFRSQAQYVYYLLKTAARHHN